MKEYYVDLPLNAKVSVTVEANDEKEAIEKAKELAYNLEIKTESKDGVHIEEWDIYDKMLEGNFWYGIIYEADVEEA